MEEIEEYERVVDKKSKTKDVVRQLTKGRNMKNLSWTLERIEMFDFYRFFRKYGNIKYSRVMTDKHWGPYFREAVILFEDMVISVETDKLSGGKYYTIYHRSNNRINKFRSFLLHWIMDNNIFRGKQFSFPFLEKTRLSGDCFVNDKIKKIIEDNVIFFMKNLSQVKQKRLKTKRGVLLYGVPGNGKTSICRWISKSLPDITRVWVTGWEMRSNAISDLFNIARDLSPSVIFLEDLDTVGISRHLAGRINSILGKLLNEMDGIEKNDGIIVIATTNNPYVLDEALANRPGRFDFKIHVGNPHPHIIRKITGHSDNITLAEAFRRKEERIYYEKILGRKYKFPSKKERVNYIG